MRHLFRGLLGAAAICFGCLPAVAASTLPGGASSLTEAHGDWTVRCAVTTAGGAVNCGVSQEQLDKGTHKRMLLIGINAGSEGGATGSLVLPFGLALESGVTLQVDDGTVTSPLHFRTCLPAGCVVPINWNKASVDALRTAKTVKAAAVSDNGQPAPFTISMAGFASALDRAIELVSAK